MARFFLIFILCCSFVFAQEEVVSALDQKAEVNELISNGKTEEALVIAGRLIENGETDVAFLKQVAEWYGWTSNGESKKIEVLEKIIEISPHENSSLRSLSFLYFWNGKSKESLPLFERYLNKNSEDHEARKAYYDVLSGLERKEDAMRQAEILLKNKPDDLDLRWSLAQACHWSTCWTKAKKQYDEILKREPAHINATKYRSLLVKEKGDLIRWFGERFTDTTGIEKQSTGLSYEQSLGAPYRLGFNYSFNHLKDSKDNSEENLNSLSSSLKYTVSETLHMTGILGVNFYIKTTPYASFKVNYTAGKGVYTEVKVEHSAYSASQKSIESNVNYTKIQPSIYAELGSWILNAALEGWLFSDENQKLSYYLSVSRYVYKNNSFHYKLGFSLSDEFYEKHYSDSDPYYTDNGPLSFVPYMDFKYSYSDQLSFEGRYAATFRDGEDVSFSPSAVLNWNFWTYNNLSLTYQSSGSKSYNFDLFNITFTRKF